VPERDSRFNNQGSIDSGEFKPKTQEDEENLPLNIEIGNNQSNPLAKEDKEVLLQQQIAQADKELERTEELLERVK